MFCKYCGKEISTEAIFCKHCGKQISNIDNYQTALGNNEIDKGNELSALAWLDGGMGQVIYLYDEYFKILTHPLFEDYVDFANELCQSGKDALREFGNGLLEAFSLGKFVKKVEKPIVYTGECEELIYYSKCEDLGMADEIEDNNCIYLRFVVKDKKKPIYFFTAVDENNIGTVEETLNKFAELYQKVSDSNKVMKKNMEEEYSEAVLLDDSKRIQLLKEYKELMDIGAISSKEFEKKKKQILES